MILIKLSNGDLNASYSFPDEKLDQAEEFYHNAETENWETIDWVYLPGLTEEEYLLRRLTRSQKREEE
jgi:hypothetical protein